MITKSGVKPFLKWAGGKSQLLSQFDDLYPNELKNGKITNYTEPFLGGGAVFFDVIRKYHIKSAMLSDVNEELILTWKVVQRDVVRLIEYLDEVQQKYLELTPEKRKEYFYQTREIYNSGKSKIVFSKYSENWIERAGQMIFLNKTCFNGLHRVNSKGVFMCHMVIIRIRTFATPLTCTMLPKCSPLPNSDYVVFRQLLPTFRKTHSFI